MQLVLITNRLNFFIWLLDGSLEVLYKSSIDLLNFIALFAGPDPPEWRLGASAAYYKNKLYYLGGMDSKSNNLAVATNRVDVR